MKKERKLNKMENLCKTTVGVDTHIDPKKGNKHVGAGLVSVRTGITLVALVITIIILLILAAITINMTIGQRGILTRAQEAGRNYQESAKREDESLSNFLKEADDIINGINGNGEGTTPSTPEISEVVKGLKAGDYIQYDTGVSTVGKNGVIVCRVLYPVDSEYGLQIISNKNVGEDITLGGNTWEKGKTAYNGAIEKLNSEAGKYVNTAYAYDGRCVGSIPTVQNGIFVNKNKLRDNEGNIQDELDTVTIPEEFTMPSWLTSRDTGCYNTDTNYTIDEVALHSAGIWTTKENYWLASRWANINSSVVSVNLRVVVPGGSIGFYNFWSMHPAGYVYPNSYNYGLRPCISLKSNIIKITGGDGLSEDTAYTIGL